MRNTIDEKIVKKEKDYLKRKSKLSYMLHKIFGNDLVSTQKNKITLTLSKPTYIGMCILDLRKLLI